MDVNSERHAWAPLQQQKNRTRKPTTWKHDTLTKNQFIEPANATYARLNARVPPQCGFVQPQAFGTYRMACASAILGHLGQVCRKQTPARELLYVCTCPGACACWPSMPAAGTGPGSGRLSCHEVGIGRVLNNPHHYSHKPHVGKDKLGGAMLVTENHCSSDHGMEWTPPVPGWSNLSPHHHSLI